MTKISFCLFLCMKGKNGYFDVNSSGKEDVCIFFSFNNCTSTPWTSTWCGESQDSVEGECLMLEDTIVNLLRSSFG